MRIGLPSRSLMFGFAASLVLLQRDALADPIAYAEQDFQYVRIDFGTGTTETIGPLTQLMLVGAFAGDDFSKEYAIDYPAGDLYSIDVATAETTLVGNTGISTSVPSGMQWDTGGMTLIAHDPECNSTALYVVDIGTGAVQQVGSQVGCLVGLAFDANDNAFSIDVVADTLVEDGSTIGPLGFDVANISAFFFDSQGILFLIAEDANTALNGVYVVDPVLGNAQFQSPSDAHYSAFALGAASDSDVLFKNGFDTQGTASLR